MLKPIRITEPSESLLTIEQVKAHLRVDHVDEDAKLDELITAATAYLDGYGGILGRCLVTQTWKLNLGDWGREIVRLPLAPVSEISSIKYFDQANEVQTLNASFCSPLLEDDLSPFIEWVGSLPPHATRRDAIEITFVAGYGSATAVPGDIKQAALSWIATQFDNREMIVVGEAMVPLPITFWDSVKPYRRIGF